LIPGSVLLSGWFIYHKFWAVCAFHAISTRV
jgi:hypothetical protein